MADDLTLALTLNVQDVQRGSQAAVQSLQAVDAQAQKTQRTLKDGFATIADDNRTVAFPRLPAGPAQRLAAANLAVRNAAAFGTPDQQADAQVAQTKAQAAADRTFNPKQNDFFSRLNTFFQSSRYSVSPGGGFQLMPLVKPTLDLLGVSGPFGAGLTAAAAGLQFLTTAIHAAGDAARSFADTRLTTGGSPAQAKALELVGGALGIDPSQVVAASKAFAMSISTNPFAQQQFGMRDFAQVPGMGRLNQANEFLQGLLKLYNAPSDKEALRMARTAPELEPFLKIRELDPATLAQVLSAAMASQKIFGSAEERAAMNTDARLAITEKLGKDQANRIFSEIANNTIFGPKGFLGGSEGDTGAPGRGGFRPGGDYGTPPPGGFQPSPIPEHPPEWDIGGELRKMNDKLAQIIPILRDTNRHIQGGGERTRNATPAHWRYRVLEDWHHDSRQALGQL